MQLVAYTFAGENKSVNKLMTKYGFEEFEHVKLSKQLMAYFRMIQRWDMFYSVLKEDTWIVVEAKLSDSHINDVSNNIEYMLKKKQKLSNSLLKLERQDDDVNLENLSYEKRNYNDLEDLIEDAHKSSEKLYNTLSQSESKLLQKQAATIDTISQMLNPLIVPL